MTLTTTVDFLLPALRLHLGDFETPYRYLDEWLTISLLESIKTLGSWWNFRYLINTSNEVYRNGTAGFIFPEPPVIQHFDERPIILMASIIIKEGSLESSSWNAVSWRDAEISFSNLEGSRSKQASLLRDLDELVSLLTPPTKRLATPLKGSLPGYLNNLYERTGRH